MQRLYCFSCGYDLEGLPERRCPECGTAFDPQAMLAEIERARPDRLEVIAQLLAIPFSAAMFGMGGWLGAAIIVLLLLPGAAIISVVLARQIVRSRAFRQGRSPALRHHLRLVIGLSLAFMSVQVVLILGGLWILLIGLYLY